VRERWGERRAGRVFGGRGERKSEHEGGGGGEKERARAIAREQEREKERINLIVKSACDTAHFQKGVLLECGRKFKLIKVGVVGYGGTQLCVVLLLDVDAIERFVDRLHVVTLHLHKSVVSE